MIKYIKFTILLCLLPLAFYSAEAKNPKDSNRDVTVVVSGYGPNSKTAVQAALRYAIEQTYGTFISSNTVILNDELIKDEVISVSSGNIKKYNVIYENPTPSGYEVKLEVTVSLDKLHTYVKSKGASAELDGNNFALNIKLEQFYAKAEMDALYNLALEVESVTDLFDFEILVSEPQKGVGDIYNVNAEIKVKANQNTIILFDKIRKTLSALSCNAETQEALTPTLIALLPRSKRKDIETEMLYFRNKDISIILSRINQHFNDCRRSFIISDNINPKIQFDIGEFIEYEGLRKGLANMAYLRTDGNADACVIPRTEGLVGYYKVTIKYTLEDISKVSKIKVNKNNEL